MQFFTKILKANHYRGMLFIIILAIFPEFLGSLSKICLFTADLLSSDTKKKGLNLVLFEFRESSKFRQAFNFSNIAARYSRNFSKILFVSRIFLYSVYIQVRSPLSQLQRSNLIQDTDES